MSNAEQCGILLNYLKETRKPDLHRVSICTRFIYFFFETMSMSGNFNIIQESPKKLNTSLGAHHSQSKKIAPTIEDFTIVKPISRGMYTL